MENDEPTTTMDDQHFSEQCAYEIWDCAQQSFEDAANKMQAETEKVCLELGIKLVGPNAEVALINNLFSEFESYPDSIKLGHVLKLHEEDRISEEEVIRWIDDFGDDDELLNKLETLGYAPSELWEVYGNIIKFRLTELASDTVRTRDDVDALIKNRLLGTARRF